MPPRRHARHRIRIPLPAALGFRLFTPRGEERFLDDWRPRYVHPADGRTEAGMVFSTGEGAGLTLWCLVDFDEPGLRARYTRVMPAMRSDLVELRCRPDGDAATLVDVEYTLTALTPAGERSLADFEAAAFAARIDAWRGLIEARLPQLLDWCRIDAGAGAGRC